MVQIQFCASLFPFHNMSLDEVRAVLQFTNPRLELFKKGDTVFSRESQTSSIGFIYSGECEVVRLRSHDEMPLNTLTRMDSFGVLSLFGEVDAFPTKIVARSNAMVVFFDKSDVFLMMQNSKTVTENLIHFLTDRILFLNHKVAMLGSSSVTEKLSKHLLFLMRSTEVREFDFNLARLSDQLNCGRASLYRSIDELVALGYISYQNKKINILSPEGLERM